MKNTPQIGCLTWVRVTRKSQNRYAPMLSLRSVPFIHSYVSLTGFVVCKNYISHLKTTQRQSGGACRIFGCHIQLCCSCSFHSWWAVHCLPCKPAGKANFWKTYAIKSLSLRLSELFALLFISSQMIFHCRFFEPSSAHFPIHKIVWLLSERLALPANRSVQSKISLVQKKASSTWKWKSLHDTIKCKAFTNFSSEPNVRQKTVDEEK